MLDFSAVLAAIGRQDALRLGDKTAHSDNVLTDTYPRQSVVSRLFRTLVGGVLRLSDQGVTLLEQFHVQIPVGRPPRGGDVT
jgi:hypothetical protein